MKKLEYKIDKIFDTALIVICKKIILIKRFNKAINIKKLEYKIDKIFNIAYLIDWGIDIFLTIALFIIALMYLLQ